MEWINIKTQQPKESDGIILCRLENKFVEICYFDDDEKELSKPWRYDKYDTTTCKINRITHWCKIEQPSVGSNKGKKRICPKCKGTGYIMHPELGHRVYEQRNCDNGQI